MDTNPASNSAPAAARSASVILLDCSPSMDERCPPTTRLDAAKVAAADFLDARLARPRPALFGVVGFAEVALEVVPLTPVERTKEILEAIDDLGTTPSTNIEAGLCAALAMFVDAPPVFGLREVILLTDGIHNTGDDPREVAMTLKNMGVIVLARGFAAGCNEVNEDLLCDLASPGPDGRPLYKFHSDSEGLRRDFRTLGGGLRRRGA